MQGARAVFAQIAIPTIAIARDPRVHTLRDEMDTWNEQEPRQEFPTREREADARPAVHTAVDSPGGIDGLHQAHGFFTINLRKASRHAWIVQVEQFNAAKRIQMAHACHACAAQAARTIVEDGQLSHSSPV